MVKSLKPAAESTDYYDKLVDDVLGSRAHKKELGEFLGLVDVARQKDIDLMAAKAKAATAQEEFDKAKAEAEKAEADGAADKDAKKTAADAAKSKLSNCTKGVETAQKAFDAAIAADGVKGFFLMLKDFSQDGKISRQEAKGLATELPESAAAPRFVARVGAAVVPTRQSVVYAIIVGLLVAGLFIAFGGYKAGTATQKAADAEVVTRAEVASKAYEHVVAANKSWRAAVEATDEATRQQHINAALAAEGQAANVFTNQK